MFFRNVGSYAATRRCISEYGNINLMSTFVDTVRDQNGQCEVEF
jgi:hypothetical protein